MSLYDKASLVQIPSGTKSGTLYSVLPANGDGDFDHTRASSATRVNKDGLIESVASGVPRLDYPLLDGVVQSCPALLLEPSRTNLVTYSEELTQWTTSGTPTVTSVNNALTGQTNAYNVEDDNSSGYERVERNATTTAAAHTLSVFIKKKTSAVSAYSGIQMDSSNKYIIFDSYNGTFNTATGNDYTEISVDDYGSYWRLKATATTSSGSTRVGLWGAISVNGTSISTSATGSETFYGVQVELGSYATSYIPTTSSTVTRSADVCNGAGTEAEFNDTESSLFVELQGLAEDNTNKYISISDGGGSPYTNSLSIQYRNNGTLRIFHNGLDFADAIFVGGSSFDLTENHKIAIRFKENDMAVYIDGVSQSLNGSFVYQSISGLNTLRFEQPNAGNAFYGKTKQLMVFNEALTDAELATLTS